MPNLTAQHPDYFVQAMLEYQRGERTHNMMQTLSASLSEDTINNMGRILGAPPKLNPHATVVPGGIVRIKELADQGYLLVKP